MHKVEASYSNRCSEVSNILELVAQNAALQFASKPKFVRLNDLCNEPWDGSRVFVRLLPSQEIP